MKVARALLCAFGLLAAACGAERATSATGEIPGLDPTHGEPRTEAWAEIAASLDAPVADRDATSCHRGDEACLVAVIDEMEVRLAERSCANTAPFAFTYLEMTRGVLAEIESFDDPAVMSVIDARFAQLYFDAFDNWYAGHTDDVPAAWQLAFATADRGETPAAVDLLLGMNAHISRDLAYPIETVLSGFDEAPDRIDDYEQVNAVIGAVKSPMLQHAAERFDRSLVLLDVELPSEEIPDSVALIGAWRGMAFDLGTRLAEAPTPAQRSEIIAEIERSSAAGAGVVVAMEAGANTPRLSPADRRTYCEAQLELRGDG